MRLQSLRRTRKEKKRKKQLTWQTKSQTYEPLPAAELYSTSRPDWEKAQALRENKQQQKKNNNNKKVWDPVVEMAALKKKNINSEASCIKSSLNVREHWSVFDIWIIYDV